MRKAFLLLVLLGWAAMAQSPLVAPEGALAFPKHMAGISAWVKLERSIIIDESLSKIFYRIEDVSENHILGSVEVADYVKKSYPRLYIDAQGWIIAFFLNSEPTASLIKWAGDAYTPQPVINTTLEAALEKAANVLRFPLSKPMFYDFRFPDANFMLVLLKILPAADTKAMYIKFPTTYTIYHASFYHYGCNYDCTGYYGESYVSTFKINGILISSLSGRFTLSYKIEDLLADRIKPGLLYELEIAYSQEIGDCGSAGLAFVIIYRSP